MSLTTHPALINAVGETKTAQTWLTDNAIPVVILLIAVTVLLAARAGNFSKAVTVVGSAFLGLGVLAMAVPTTAASVGTWVAGLVGI